MIKILRVLACASLFVFLSFTAYADYQGGQGAGMGGGGMSAPPDGGSRGGPREACRQDAQQFCQNIQPGGGRIRDCLEDHYKELSDACYDALKNAPPPPPIGQGGGWHRGGGQQQEGQQGEQPQVRPSSPPDDDDGNQDSRN